eukprot:6717661-Alexandrium_andersonii.AAC.1
MREPSSDGADFSCGTAAWGSGAVGLRRPAVLRPVGARGPLRARDPCVGHVLGPPGDPKPSG